MKKTKVIKNLKKMLNEMVPPINYENYHSLKEALNMIENIEDEICSDCGEKKVCPKCEPVIEKTNSIIIRFKDTDYNGGYPNCLIISPLYTNKKREAISCATLTGDNFENKEKTSFSFSYMERATIEETASILANSSIKEWSRLFGFPEDRNSFAEDIRKKLIEYVESTK